jgi:hypothetical protein
MGILEIVAVLVDCIVVLEILINHESVDISERILLKANKAAIDNISLFDHTGEHIVAVVAGAESHCY